MEKKNKKNKIIIGTACFLIAAIMIVVTIIMNMPEKEYENVFLEDMEFTKKVENISEIYIDNEMSAVTEDNKKINISEVISYEKFILDNKIGMYDFSISSDFDESKLTFIVKNHTKETVEAFKYRLQLLNNDGSIYGTMDLESPKIPALSKYKVTVNIDSDVADVYDIIPITDFQEYGFLGGECYEVK